MKRLLLLAAAVVLVGGAAVFSRTLPAAKDAAPADAPPAKVQVATEEKNPWTSLRVNASGDQFQFLIVSDRTGGHRAKIFSRAVEQINLLQPEFVMSVGDLIEGYTTKPDQLDKEWAEFTSFTKRLQMPFFMVPGNHDLANPDQAKDWSGRFGRTYYHFVYKDVLFLAVNSEDPVSKISEEQVAYFEKALADNPGVRWTLVFLHKPMWVPGEAKADNGWEKVEKLLAGRKYTVFCGHVHRYQKYVRNGMNYYQLATTGGGSRLRGVKFGEFDHVVWVTMKNDGPTLANVMLDGVLPEDLRVPDTDEPGQPRKTERTHLLNGRVLFDGKPAADATVRFYKRVTVPKERYQSVADGLTEADGTFVVSTYGPFDGIPAGEYVVTAVQTGGYAGGGARAENLFPAKYATPETSPLRVTVAPGENRVDLNLSR